MADRGISSWKGSSCSPFCSQPTEWEGEATTFLGNISLKVFVNCIPEQLDIACSDIFREGIKKSLKFDCAACFVVLCEKLTQDHSYRSLGTSWEDLTFAYNCAATERPHFIATICREKMEKGQAPTYLKWDELRLLMHATLKAKQWNTLPALLRVELDGQSFNHCCQHTQVGECVVLFLLDEASWQIIAPIVDQWVKNRRDWGIVKLVEFVQGRLKRESCSENVSRAKQWCVDNGHANLAFVLALVTKDWDLVESAVTSFSLDVHKNTLLGVARMVSRPEEQGGSFSTGASILAACPIDDVMYTWPLWDTDLDLLSSACEKRGQWDLALVIQRNNVTYLLNCYQFCQNRSVLDSILVMTVDFETDGKGIELVLALLKGCKDFDTLRKVLRSAIRLGHGAIVEALLNRVDPTEFILEMNLTLVASHQNKVQKGEILRMLLAAGLAPFLRDVDDRTVPDMSPLMIAFWEKLPEFVNLILESGSYCHKTLNAVANDAEVQKRAKRDEELKKCLVRIQEAACTPTHLEQLARLAVSRSIGCRPGRAERVDKLPLPTKLKEMVKFNDVLHPETER